MIVDVAVPFPVYRTYHYSVEEGLASKIHPGSLVGVSFGKKTTHGFVLGLLPEPAEGLTLLKNVEALLADDPIFSEPTLQLLKWMARYYHAPIGEVLSLAHPRFYLKKLSTRKRASPRGESASKVVSPCTPPKLTPSQQSALEQIFDTDVKTPILLHGITGSGKTEIYLRLIEQELKKEKASLMLVPEIALTPQLEMIFNERFPEQVAVLHSQRTPQQRLREVTLLRSGVKKIAVGARSSIFAPIHRLGLIVVDEEHEGTYKQEEKLRYHARDVAVVRAQFEGARIVLGSATPSLESYANALSGRYKRVELRARVYEQPLPHITLVDLKKDAFPPTLPYWFSRTLWEAVSANLSLGEQTLLFLNRLGYAHFLACEDCGEAPQCRQCDLSLTYYAAGRTLKCHLCGFITQAPDTCFHCNGHHLKPIGLGTEQVEDTLRQLYPKARIERMDRSQIQSQSELVGLLERVRNGEVDILIGTQMLAKGHDFAKVSLVGVILADAHFHQPDFRAHERTFQLITQVAGRAGRRLQPGRVIIQSWNPEHPTLQLASENNWQDFYLRELARRNETGFPPATRLAVLSFQHKLPKKVETFAQWFSQKLRDVLSANTGSLELRGPSLAPIAFIKHHYRWQLLVKSRNTSSLHGLLDFAQSLYDKSHSNVRFSIDVDPFHLS